MTRYLETAPGTADNAAHISNMQETVTEAIAAVRAAVREYSEKFDGWSPTSFRLAAEDIERIVATIPDQAIEDIKAVQRRVRTFAQHQKDSLADFEVETEPE